MIKRLKAWLRHSDDCHPMLRGGGLVDDLDEFCTCGLVEALKDAR